MTVLLLLCVPQEKHFNSHPHEEDDARLIDGLITSCISTHILTKRMTNTQYIYSSFPIFQLTSSRRGWQDQLLEGAAAHDISTHILTKRMTVKTGTTSSPTIFQLTSSRRGWHTESVKTTLDRIISTHILTKRMTVNLTRKSLRKKHFNSHPHEEDDALQTAFNCAAPISTHILTKRMTLLRANPFQTVVYFNSHPHEEDDSLPLRLTAPHWYFNSHPHEEDDSVTLSQPPVLTISTHILTKRMTEMCIKIIGH